MRQLSLILLLVAIIASDAGKMAALTACTVSALQQKAPPGTTITAAAVVAAEGTTPEYCRVDGYVATPGNTVNFRLGLPQRGTASSSSKALAASAARSDR